MAHQVQSPDLINLNGIEERLKLELWEDNDRVTSICAGLGNDDQPVNVTEWKKTQSDFCPLALWPRVSRRFLICSDLQDVCNDIVMADHNTFLETHIN